MDSPTPGTSSSMAKAPDTSPVFTDSDGVQVITISDDGVGRPPVQRQRFSLNINTTFEECQQLFGSTCHVKLKRCQPPVTAASKTTAKEEDSSDDDTSSSSPQEEQSSRTVPAGSDAAPASNIVPKPEDDSSTGSSSEDEEILPTERPRRKKKQTKNKKPAVKTVDCPICGKTLSARWYLKFHMKIHTRKKREPHKCEHCGRWFSDLTGHKKRNPNGLCKDKDWMKRPPPPKSVQQMARKLMEPNWRPRGSWKCKICEKRIKSSCKYLSHMRSHVGERPYKCDQCEKCFTAQKYLSNHRKIHSSVGEFSCIFCGKEFYQEQNLWIHLRCHTEEKPFFCVVTGCGASFRHSGSLKKHQRLIHLKMC